MPSQTRYILEAVFGILLILLSIKFIQFASHSNLLVESPGSVIIDDDQVTSTTSGNDQGRTLFKDNCASCHSITKNLVGPALAGIEVRVPDRKLLIAWIKNNQQVLKSGNVYFNDLFLQYNKKPMNLFTQLDEKEIEAILTYISGK